MVAQHPSSTGPLWWIRRVVALIVVLGVGAVLAAAVVVPRIAGATPYSVLTASMRPGLPPGTLVVVRPVDVEEIALGSVITYQLASGEPTVVTHRVVGVGINPKGERAFRTQGDANGGVDAEPVRPAQIHGEVWYSVPHLGFVAGHLSPGTRRAATLTVAGSLALYALGMLVAAIREHQRRRPASRRTRGAEA